MNESDKPQEKPPSDLDALIEEVEKDLDIAKHGERKTRTGRRPRKKTEEGKELKSVKPKATPRPKAEQKKTATSAAKPASQPENEKLAWFDTPPKDLPEMFAEVDERVAKMSPAEREAPIKMEAPIKFLSRIVKKAEEWRHPLHDRLDAYLLAFKRIDATLKGINDKATVHDYAKLKEWESGKGEVFNFIRLYNRFEALSSESIMHAIHEIETARLKVNPEDPEYKELTKYIDTFQSLLDIRKGGTPRVFFENDVKYFEEYEAKSGKAYRLVQRLSTLSPDEWTKEHRFKPAPSSVTDKYFGKKKENEEDLDETEGGADSLPASHGLSQFKGSEESPKLISSDSDKPSAEEDKKNKEFFRKLYSPGPLEGKGLVDSPLVTTPIQRPEEAETPQSPEALPVAPAPSPAASPEGVGPQPTEIETPPSPESLAERRFQAIIKELEDEWEKEGEPKMIMMGEIPIINPKFVAFKFGMGGQAPLREKAEKILRERYPEYNEDIIRISTKDVLPPPTPPEPEVAPVPPKATLQLHPSPPVPVSIPAPAPEALKTYHPAIEQKMAQMGVTAEMIGTVPGFEKVADSEGKLLWVLQNLQQTRSRRISADARAEFEREQRSVGRFRRIGRRMLRGGYIKEKEQAHARRGFDIEKYKEDMEKLATLANAGPELVIREKDGKTEVGAAYIRNLKGVAPEKLLPFNEAATAYAKLPPEKEWKKHSPKEVKEYQKIKDEYYTRKNLLLNEIPHNFKTLAQDGQKSHNALYSKDDAISIINDADFEVKMHQTLIHHPEVELKLARLATTKGWSRTWDIAKAQMGIGAGAGLAGGGIGFVAGSGALRLSVKSAILMTASAAAMPVLLAGSAVGLGVLLGKLRGGMKAEEQLRNEEELIRMGFEEQTQQSKIFEKRRVFQKMLVAEKNPQKRKELEEKIKEDATRKPFEERWKIKEKLKTETNPKKINKLEEKLESVDKEISRLKGTNENFVRADALIEKIAPLQEILKMDAAAYRREHLKSTHSISWPDHQAMEQEFKDKQRECADKLQVRLVYARRKLNEGKISFGKEEDSLTNRLEFIQAMADASAALLLSPYAGQEKEFTGKSGKKYTRKDRLWSALHHTEEIIKDNQAEFIRKQKKWGMIMGGTFGLVGFGVGKAVAGVAGFGSEVIKDVQEEAQALKAVDINQGKALETEVKDKVEAVIAKAESDKLIEESSAKPVIPPEIPTEIPPEKPKFRVTPLTSSALRDDTEELPKRAGVTLFDKEGRVRNMSLVDDAPIRLDNFSGRILYGGRVAPVESDEKVFNPYTDPTFVDKTPEAPVTAEKVSAPKPFEITLTNETQSREYALKKYYESKGMSRAEAGKKAYLEMQKATKEKGERILPFVHKGDKIIISEVNGKTEINVLSKGKVFDSRPDDEVEKEMLIKDGQVDRFTGKKIGGDSAPRAVTRVLRTHAEEYGFKGDPDNKEAVKEWADAMTKEVLKQNPGLNNFITHDGDELDLTRTPSGGWYADIEHKGKVTPFNPKEIADAKTSRVPAPTEKAPAPTEPAAAPVETPAAPTTPAPVEPSLEAPAPTPEIKFEDTLSAIEIKEASDLPSIIDNAFSKEPRFAALSEANKDKFIFQIMMQYIETAQEKEDPSVFFKSMNITSGRPFDIPAGKINLGFGLDEKAINEIFKDVAEGKVPDDVVGLRKNLEKVVEALKDSPTEDLNKEMILGTIKGTTE